MKLVINQGVRDTIADLGTLLDQYDQLTGTLANRTTSNAIAVQAGYDKTALKDRIVSCAAKILSHATRGRRYPNMTHYRNFKF